MFAQIKTIVEIATSGFKSLNEFKTKHSRDQAVTNMLSFYFLLKDAIDEGENLIVDAGSNPIAKLNAMSAVEATKTVSRWDKTLRRQGIRLRELQGLLYGQHQLAVINPDLEAALDKALGSKFNRSVSLSGIGSVLFIRCMVPLSESEVDKAKLIATMAGEKKKDTLNLLRIRREIRDLRTALDEYRSFIGRLCSDEEIVKLSKKARGATRMPSDA